MIRSMSAKGGSAYGGKTVIAFGTFDIFHPGHASYLSQAKKLGDYLVVVVARNRTVEMIKKKKPQIGERKRRLEIQKSDLAEKVILGSLKNKYSVIQKYRPDIIALGYDQKVNLTELKKKLQEFKLKTEVVRLKPHNPEKYKSSKLKDIKL